MRKAFLFFAMIIAVGLTACKSPDLGQLRAEANQRLNCPARSQIISNVKQVTLYPSGAIEVSRVDPYKDHSIFLSPDDRLSLPQFVYDLPAGRAPWVYLDPAGAYISGMREGMFGVAHDWSCMFILQIHLSPGSASQVIDDQR